jgi:hypothetical protein
MPRITLITCICLLGMSAATQAQQGDRTGEIQPTLPETFDRPVSPARSAEEQLQSFAVSR